jgi:hypothetical protein
MARSIVDEDIPKTEEDEEEEQPKIKPKVFSKSPAKEAEVEVRIVTENQLVLNQLEYIIKQNEGIIKGLRTLGANLD